MLKKKKIIINNLLLDLNILISCMNILENCEWSIDSMHLKTGLIFLVICLALQVQESRGKFIYKRIILINFNRLGGGGNGKIGSFCDYQIICLEFGVLTIQIETAQLVRQIWSWKWKCWQYFSCVFPCLYIFCKRYILVSIHRHMLFYENIYINFKNKYMKGTKQLKEHLRKNILRTCS